MYLQHEKGWQIPYRSSSKSYVCYWVSLTCVMKHLSPSFSGSHPNISQDSEAPKGSLFSPLFASLSKADSGSSKFFCVYTCQEKKSGQLYYKWGSLLVTELFKYNTIFLIKKWGAAKRDWLFKQRSWLQLGNSQQIKLPRFLRPKF